MVRLTFVLAAVLVVLALGASSRSVDAQQACHASYAGGECLDAAASDYDCVDGTGDGPAYVNYQVQVVGPDTFGLDADSDGIGCDNLSILTGGTTPAGNTSDVAGVAGAPTAGFGPDESSASMLGLMTAGLVGAALAWLTAGGLGLRLLSRSAPSARGDTGFLPRMLPRN